MTPYDVILAQLGGNKFIAMTGARNLVTRGKADLAMKLPRGARDGINHVRIELNAADLYDVTFSKARGLQSSTVAKVDGVYADQLCAVFESRTGLRVSL